MDRRSALLFIHGLELSLAFLAIVVVWFRGLKAATLFAGSSEPMAQLPWGFLLGVPSALVCLWLVGRFDIFSTVIDLIAKVNREFNLQDHDWFYISISAGICEELLFRGAIQPVLGIIWTSLLFIGLHGYFKPSDKGMTLYGCLLFCISCGLGHLRAEIGMFAAMAGHFSFDLVMLLGMQVSGMLKASDAGGQEADPERGPDEDPPDQDQA